jgi:hypothetical protein
MTEASRKGAKAQREENRVAVYGIAAGLMNALVVVAFTCGAFGASWQMAGYILFGLAAVLAVWARPRKKVLRHVALSVNARMPPVKKPASGENRPHPPEQYRPPAPPLGMLGVKNIRSIEEAYLYPAWTYTEYTTTSTPRRRQRRIRNDGPRRTC